ncbi:DUF1761 domain-containing protein [Tessaracoccus caeni]|uniref:DUF1761 domain-containing protein n=1 Tax=Tessaracoccus caeni TaxID=3031239 RepID=UPI0023DC09EB|nr:DUF1761 domain-containing protein [Tessaracoccus caeni]MDF1489431.1 DUF1761 domain-containing protein [Tessaracoccus caeni]
MFDVIAHVSWLGVALAALAYYILGAIWFTPLFGKTWDRAIGHEVSGARRFGADYYIVPLVSAVLVSVALGVLLAVAAPASMSEALIVGVIVGGGVALPVSMNNALTPHTPHPYVFGAVTGGYHMVGIVVVAAVLGGFMT